MFGFKNFRVCLGELKAGDALVCESVLWVEYNFRCAK